jgi:hypothetical protein
MPTFVLVANGINKKQFEKATELSTKAGNKLSFVPQASNANGANTQGLTTYRPNPMPNQPSAEELFSNVRYEWNIEGAEFGAELVKILAHHHEDEKA